MASRYHSLMVRAHTLMAEAMDLKAEAAEIEPHFDVTYDERKARAAEVRESAEAYRSLALSYARMGAAYHDDISDLLAPRPSHETAAPEEA